ncbi:MAG: EAL domain-containing protein, partial [Clostridiales bacterium]|nr:EAL domain-containing protein [Clostridiales bacterium]
IFNDIFGASEGDKLLAYIGKKIIQDSPAGVFGARLRADHFITCWPKALFHAGKTMEHVMGWLEAYPVQYKFSVRLGIYLIEEPELCVQRMCDRALLAASVDKGSYVSKYVYYDSALREQMLEEQALIMDLGKALEERQFELYFQPQYDYTTMEMVGVEALVRWNHPRRGFLLPNAFVPAFERSGLITSLDLYVWEEACRCLRAWMDEYPEDEPVSLAVNLSRLDIYDRTICEKITGIVRKYGLSPALLRLEITESAYMDLPEQMIQAVKQLQDAGFVLEMDDFGKGYSSLNMLKDVPVDILKLDMHFLDTKKSDRGSTILRSVVRMAHWLSLCTIAEGVETREQADFLLSIGCRYMQGYYFARPMPRAEFEAMALAGKRAPIERSGGKAFPVGQRTLRQAGCPNAQVVNCYMGAAQLEAVVKGVPGGLVLYEVGREIRTLFFNDAAAALSGHTRQEYRELTREDALALAHEEDAARMREGMRTLAAAAPRIDLVYRIRHKDGGCRWVRLSGTVTRREEEAVYVSAVLLDVTDEKKIEALAAQREQEHYRFILQHMGAAVFEWDLATGETYASAEYEEYGLSQLGPRVLAANADPRALACPAD